MRSFTLACIALLTTWSETAPAQAFPDSAPARAPGSLCYRAQPKPACSAFLLTNFGSYLVIGQPQTGPLYGLGPLRGVADWGVMVNLGGRDAAGVSVFASVEQQGFVLGPAVRYRRWLSNGAALEVAAGTPVTSSTDNILPGSVFGLVRWSPNSWFAVAARPELVRGTVFSGCGPSACNADVRWRGRVSLGVEIGGAAGFTLTAVTGVAALVGAALVAAGGN